MEQRYSIGEAEHTVSAPSEREWSLRGEGLCVITVDGVERVVEVLESGPHHLDLVIDGRRVVVYTAPDEAGDGVWVGAGGRTRLVAQRGGRGEQRRSGVRGAQGARKVMPSFPATVVSVMVEAGQEVSKGEPLVVVSAMKMEMTLSAPYDGVVSAVNVKEGAAVSPGDELVVIDEAAPGDEESVDE